jgi:microcystin-dependent protein
MGLTKIIGGMLNMGTPAEGDVLSFIGSKWIPKKVSGVPAGAMMSFAGGTAPEGWLLCHGQAVGRTTYAGLFSALGTAYGTGDGSTTFNLPDLRGRTPIGLDNMGGSAANRITNSAADVLGGNGGLESRTPAGSISGSTGNTTLSTSQIPVHGHPQTWKTSWNNSLTTMMVGTDGSSGCVNAQIGSANGGLSSCGYATNEANMVFTQNRGGGAAHNHPLSASFSGSALEVTQPWLAVNVIIKT